MDKFIACDFDGTIFTNAWPKIGKPIPEVIAYLKGKQFRGDKIGLWTCREGKMLQEALDACAEQGLIFNTVNANAEERMELFHNDPRKIGADEYIDDLATTVESIVHPIKYVCDRRKCEHCHPECHLTEDISHAANFEKDENVYVEKWHPSISWPLKSPNELRAGYGLPALDKYPNPESKEIENLRMLQKDIGMTTEEEI